MAGLDNDLDRIIPFRGRGLTHHLEDLLSHLLLGGHLRRWRCSGGERANGRAGASEERPGLFPLTAHGGSVDDRRSAVQTLFSLIPFAPGYDSREMNDRQSDAPPGHPLMQLLPWYLSGTLNDTERRQVAAHLARCHVCRAELEALTLMRRMVREAFAESAAGRMRRLLSRIFKPTRRDLRLTAGIDNNG
jgi:hypothetical protein